MELRHLRYFVAVAEAENVSRAALKLHVSQPAVSRQIRDLEDYLGFALLERSAKSVRLTRAGREFLDQARAVLARAEEAVRTARAVASGRQEELHVGYAPTLAVRLLPPTLRAFQNAMPNICVKLHDLSSEEILTGVRAGKLHLGITVRPAARALRGLDFEELMTEPLRLAVAPTHLFARSRVVPLAEAAREPFVAYSREEYPDYHALLAQVFGDRKAQPRIIEEHDGVSSLISAIAAGIGVAIVPDSMSCVAGVTLKFLPVSPDPKPLIIGAIRSQEHNTAASEQFVECSKKALKDRVNENPIRRRE